MDFNHKGDLENLLEGTARVGGEQICLHSFLFELGLQNVAVKGWEHQLCVINKYLSH